MAIFVEKLLNFLNFSEYFYIKFISDPELPRHAMIFTDTDTLKVSDPQHCPAGIRCGIVFLKIFLSSSNGADKGTALRVSLYSSDRKTT
jgi:hypothetical protein